MSTYYLKAYNKSKKISIPIEEKWLTVNFDCDLSRYAKICENEYDVLNSGTGINERYSEFNSHITIPYNQTLIVNEAKLTIIDFWNAIALKGKTGYNDMYQAPSALLKPKIGNSIHTRIGDKINVKTITYGITISLNLDNYVGLQWSNELKGQNALLQKIQTAANAIPDYLANNGQNVYTLYASTAAQSKDLFNFVYDSATSEQIAPQGAVNGFKNPNMKFNFRLFVVEFDEKYNIISMKADDLNNLLIDWYKTVFKHNSVMADYNTQSNKMTIKNESSKYAGEFKIKLDKSFKLTGKKPYKYLDLQFNVNQNCELRKNDSTVDSTRYTADENEPMYINKWANTVMFILSPCLYETDMDPTSQKAITAGEVNLTASITGNAKMIYYDV